MRRRDAFDGYRGIMPSGMGDLTVGSMCVYKISDQQAEVHFNLEIQCDQVTNIKGIAIGMSISRFERVAGQKRHTLLWVDLHSWIDIFRKPQPVNGNPPYTNFYRKAGLLR